MESGSTERPGFEQVTQIAGGKYKITAFLKLFLCRLLGDEIKQNNTLTVTFSIEGIVL